MSVRLSRVNGALRWSDDAAKPDLCVVITCPHCGADTETVASGSKYVFRVAAGLRCTECRWVGGVSVELATIRDTGARSDASRLTRQDPYEAMSERRRKNRQKVAL